MKILNRYVIFTFIKPFGYSIFVFSVFMFFGTAFEKIKFFSRVDNGVLLLWKYLFFQFPFFVSMVVPISYLLATLFLINTFMTTGQLKAFLSGGYKPFDIVKPLLLFSLFIGVLHFFFNELVMNAAFIKSKIVYNEELKKNLKWDKELIANSFKIGKRFIYYNSYDFIERKFTDVIVEEINEHNIRERNMKALFMKWENDKWVLEKAKILEYPSLTGKNLREKRYEKFYLDLPSPENLVLEKVIENGISFFELRHRIIKMKNSGIKSDMEFILMNFKISQPLSNFTMAFLGCAVIFGGLVYGKFLSIGVAVFIGFIFWSFTVIAQRMSEIKMLSPFWGAFLPHIVFISFSLLLFKKKKLV